MENLRNTLGSKYTEKELRRIARKTYSHYVMVLVDFIRLPSMTEEELKKNLRIIGSEYFLEATAKGRGVVFGSGHIGCWEMAMPLFAAHGYKTAVYARPIHNQTIDRWINSLRESHRVKVISTRFSLREIILELSKGNTVGFLFDQDARHNGVFVDFLGRSASTHKGPAFCALKANCPIMAGFIFRGEDGLYDAFMHPPIYPDINKPAEEEITRIIKELSIILEEYVYKYPDQYFWFHRRWKSSPPVNTRNK